MVEEQVTGTEKEATRIEANVRLSAAKGKLSNFDLVTVGTCPHCGGSLDSGMPTTGRGINRRCSQCQHIWY